MPFKSKEIAEAYRQRRDVKDAKNEKARERYKTDVVYRRSRIDLAMAHQRTPRGSIQSRIRILNNMARNGGWAECNASADDVIAANNGFCACCARKDRPLVIDHDHVSGVFRGWLCGFCNSGLGYFGESVSELEAAIGYLNRHKTK